MSDEYWEQRWVENQTGWDIGYASTPLVEYFDQLNNKNIKILIPGCGNAYEAEHLIKAGFTNVWVIDISKTAIQSFLQRFPAFPKSNAVHGDFFDLKDSYDLIIEQTFFCALNPRLRSNYAQKAHDLLSPNGRLVGLLFDTEFSHAGPPHGGTKQEYLSYFNPLFDEVRMESAYNSIEQRQGRELFINMRKMA